MPYTVKVDDDLKRKILEHVEDCYFSIVRGGDDLEDAWEHPCTSLYVSAAQGKPFDSVQEVEFANVGELFRSILDGFLDHAVKAREYAFVNITEIERAMGRSEHYSAQWLDRLDAYPYSSEQIRFGRQARDPLSSEPYDTDLTKVKRSALLRTQEAIQDRIQHLRVVCLSAPKRDALSGRFNLVSNQIVVWPFTQIWPFLVDVRDPSLRAYSALVGHTFLHELAHFLEPCQGVILAVLRKKLTDLNLTTRFDTWQIAKFIGSNFNDLAVYYGHCHRFKYALLYLSYKQKFIRKSLFEQIEKSLQDAPPFWDDPGERALKKDGTPKVAGKYRKPVWVREPDWGLIEPDLSSKEAVQEAAYGWENVISEELKSSKGAKSPMFVPKSFVESVSDLTERLIELDRTEGRIRSNFKRGPSFELDLTEEVVNIEGMLISPQGFANLYLEESDDPFELAFKMIQSPKLKALEAIALDLNSPFVGIYYGASGVVPLYSDGSGEVWPVTFEEFWWILSL